MARKTGLPTQARQAFQVFGAVLGAGIFFLVTCLCSAATVKMTTMVLIIAVLAAAFLFWKRLQDRVGPVIVSLGLFVLMDAVSCGYAVSGKFALYEFLKVMCAFCMALLLLAFTGEEKPERKVAVVLEGCLTIAAVVSIDMLSTRWISTPVLTLLSWFTPDYMDLGVVEDGIRMTSVFMSPNVYGGCSGIAVLLCLGLAASSEKPCVRATHLVCLSINALGFMLAFSMGACLSIAPAFLVFLLLTGKEQRTGMLILMVETLLLTLLAAFPISMTSMTVWTGVRPIPLLCLIASAVLLCLLDLFVGRRLAEKLVGHGKAVLGMTVVLVVGAVVFLITASMLTTGTTLEAGGSLRRSAYPKAGEYTVVVEGDGDPLVSIQSQNREDTMMHTYSNLYYGPLSAAAFTVPEDSLVVWFQFATDSSARLDSVNYIGDSGSGSVPLGYRLLPGFIANRLQGLRANQNAIQRFVFFEDGLKLFFRSPIIGLGMGAFENGVRGVQTFRYDTKYAHNHYIQTMAETGIVGLMLFLVLLALCGAAIWRGRKRDLAPALGATLIFIAIHGMVEFTLSSFSYLPTAFGVFAVISLCCGDMIPLPAWAEKGAVRSGLTLGMCALLMLFGVLLGCNITAQRVSYSAGGLEDIERAASLDPFEKADHMLTYVVWVTGMDLGEEVRQKADAYAEKLGKIDSNIIPYYLAEYYLDDGRTDLGFEMVERYVTYVSADARVWQRSLDLLEQYEQDTDEYRAGVLHIAALMDAWNEENMGYVGLDEKQQAFVDRIQG